MRNFISLFLTVLTLTSSVFAVEKIVTEGTQDTVISGDTTLVKQGTGTYTLNQSNSYTGGTRIEAGTLQLSGTTAQQVPLGEGGTVTIQNGGTLLLNYSSMVLPKTRRLMWKVAEPLKTQPRPLARTISD